MNKSKRTYIKANRNILVAISGITNAVHMLDCTMAMFMNSGELPEVRFNLLNQKKKLKEIITFNEEQIKLLDNSHLN